MNEVHTEVLDAMHNKSSSDREGSAKTDGDVGEFTSYGSRRRLFIFILLLSYLEICLLYRMIPTQLCIIALVERRSISCTVSAFYLSRGKDIRVEPRSDCKGGDLPFAYTWKLGTPSSSLLRFYFVEMSLAILVLEVI